MTRKRGIRFAAAGAIGGLLLGGTIAVAAELKAKKDAAPQMPPEMADMLKFAQPGEHHKHMAKMVGTWRAKGKFWMAPGAPPSETEGTMTVKPVLDGRFFASDYKGPFLGQEFHGMALDGYDNLKQKHVGTWVDSMGTMIMYSEGTCSQGGKVTEMKAEFTDPMTQKPSYMRSVVTWKDDNTVVMEAFGPGPEGNEVKMFEITYTRS